MAENTIEPYTGLQSIISELQDKLLQYSKKPAANQDYIKRQQAVLNDLNAVAESIVFYSLHPAWTTLQTMIDNTLQSDPSIESFQCNINFKPVTNRISVIDVNLF